jgi:hypothetical protein
VLEADDILHPAAGGGLLHIAGLRPGTRRRIGWVVKIRCKIDFYPGRRVFGENSLGLVPNCSQGKFERFPAKFNHGGRVFRRAFQDGGGKVREILLHVCRYRSLHPARTPLADDRDDDERNQTEGQKDEKKLPAQFHFSPFVHPAEDGSASHIRRF